MEQKDWSKIRPTNQDDFIYYSIYKIKHSKYRIYFDQNGNQYYPSHWVYKESIESKINQLYYEGFFVLKLLKCSFEDFSLAVIKEKGVHPWEVHLKLRKKHRQGYWFDLHKVDYRQPMKFQQNGTKKKEKNRTKTDWRKNKGFEKDYRKNEKGLHKTFAKRSSNKEFRRMETQKIQQEKYEDLFWGIRKDYFDPWDWD